VPQTGDEGRRSPAAIGDFGRRPASAPGTPVAAVMLVFAQVSSMKMRRDGSSAGCVSSHAARDAGDIGTILLDWCQCLFLSVILLAFRKRQIEPIAARTPRSSRQPGLHRMQGQIVLRRYQCQQPSGVLILDPRVGRAAHRLGRGSPRVQPATPPVTTVETLTAKREAAVRQLAPASMVAITRFRKSCE